MTRAHATITAQRVARESQTPIAVVNEGPHADDFAEHDDDGHSYGFCPEDSVQTLFRFGTVVEVVHPGRPARYQPPGVFDWILRHPDALPKPLPRQGVRIHREAAKNVRNDWSTEDPEKATKAQINLEQICNDVALASGLGEALVWYHPDTDSFWHYPE